VLADLRFALRQLRKSPGFTLTAVLTLALGIGANTAVFSLVNAILLRQLPFKDASRVVTLDLGLCGIGICEDSQSKNPVGELHSQEKSLRSFQYVSEYWHTFASIRANGAPAERIPVTEVTAHFLDALGVQPVVGRNFRDSEDLPGQDAVVILSYRLWQTAFHGRENVLGSSIFLNAHPFTVIGIAPRGVDFPDKSDAWAPTALDMQAGIREEGAFLPAAVMRLADGASLRQAQAEVVAHYESAKKHGQSVADQPRLQSIAENLTASLRPALLMLSGAVTLVMLIVCANVAGLMVARASGQRAELAVRAALGATHAAMMRQQWIFSVMIALCGGVCGIACAAGLLHLLYALRPPALAGTAEPSLAIPVLVYTILLSVLTGLLFGLAPAWLAAKQDPGEALKTGQWKSSAGSSRLQRALVCGEIALALTLLAGAGLLVRTMQKMGEIQLGFETSRLLTFSVTLHGTPYTAKTPAAPPAVVNFEQSVMEKLRALPGVSSVAGVDAVPLHHAAAEMLVFATRQGGDQIAALPRRSTPGYFATMGIPLLEGRDFAESDNATSPKVVIVTRDLADKLWRGREAVGQQMQCFWGCDKGATVIGVVASQKSFGVRNQGFSIYYTSSKQINTPAMTYVLRTKLDSGALDQSVRAAVASVDATQPVFHLVTMKELLDDSESLEKLERLTLSVFSVLAVVLAAVGIYGTIAYSVNRRTREIGLRMALGARREDISRAVLIDSLKLTIFGCALGVAGALGLGHFLQSVVFGISTHDPLTLIAAFVVFAGVSSAAAWIPANRAASVEPMEALRSE
jgi:putative ABC transport system permease protein